VARVYCIIGVIIIIIIIIIIVIVIIVIIVIIPYVIQEPYRGQRAAGGLPP
jgi:hypothetical protein